VIKSLSKSPAASDCLGFLKPLLFKSSGSVVPPERPETAGGSFTRDWVGVVSCRLSLRERCWRTATTPTPPLKRRGF
jgi:hypothetical protein